MNTRSTRLFCIYKYLTICGKFLNNCLFCFCYCYNFWLFIPIPWVHQDIYFKSSESLTANQTVPSPSMTLIPNLSLISLFFLFTSLLRFPVWRLWWMKNQHANNLANNEITTVIQSWPLLNLWQSLHYQITYVFQSNLQGTEHVICHNIITLYKLGGVCC